MWSALLRRAPLTLTVPCCCRLRFDDELVQVRICQAVPEVRVCHDEFLRDADRFAGLQRQRLDGRILDRLALVRQPICRGLPICDWRCSREGACPCMDELLATV